MSKELDDGDTQQTRSSCRATDQTSGTERLCIRIWFQAQDRHPRRRRRIRRPRRTANRQAEEGHGTSIVSQFYHLAHNRSVGFPSDANFPVDPPAFSTGPSQSAHTSALPSSKCVTTFASPCPYAPLLYFIPLGNNHACSRLSSTQVPSQCQGPLPDIWSSP